MRPFWKRPLLRIPLVLAGILLAAGLALLFGLIVMLLWNWLMPQIFGLPALSYWQSWGLVLMAHILFKAGAGPGYRHEREEGENWKRRFREQLKRRFAPQPDQGEEKPQPS